MVTENWLAGGSGGISFFEISLTSSAYINEIFNIVNLNL